MAEHPTYRLPLSARPRRYALELAPDLAAATFSGRVAIDIDVVEATRRLVLNAVDLDVSQASLDGPGGVRVPALSTRPEEQQLVLDFDHELPPGTGYSLTLVFTGVLNDQLRGFYRSTFRDGSGTERVIATTQFEATDARRAFPCWDEPEFKASFQVTLVVDDGVTGLSNGPLESSRRRDDGLLELRFAETMVMSTYLVAFVVGPYELSEAQEVAGVPVRVAAVTGKLGLSGYAAEVARHSLAFLAAYFNIPYPAAKLDHVAVPDFAFGAMENLGCVTYRESLLLVEPTSAAQTELQRIATVVAHETAHMWFGDLVTMKWWNGIWLNEAFATFMELTATDAFRPEWQVWTAFGAGKAAAMATDGLRATRPVEFPVGRPEEAEGMFDVLTYQKGGSVLKMLEQYLGPEVFRKGISHYLSTHAYANTETSDLWDALEAVSGEPVRAMMDSWISQGGYPVLQVDRGPDPASVTLRQRRFRYDGSTAGGGTDEPLWSVPVNLRASVGGGRIEHARLLLDGPQASFSFSGPVEWVVVNEGAWGFYRTRYSPDLLGGLIAAGPHAVLDPLERLQLVGDTWASVVAGQADLSEWATAARSVAADPDPDVWGSLGAVLDLLRIIADDSDLEALTAFAAGLAGPAWAELGWEAAPGEDDRRATARARLLGVLADVGGDETSRQEAVRRLEDHLSGAEPDASARLAPDLVGAAARVAVASGGRRCWQDVLEAYGRAERPQEQLRFLYALAETPDPDLRKRTLEMTLGNDVRSQDGPFVVGSILAQRGAGAEAWRWVEENWGRISERFPPSLQMRVLEGVTAFVDPDLVGSVHRFRESTDLALSPVRLDQVLERMDVNAALARRLRGSMTAALSVAAP